MNLDLKSIIKSLNVDAEWVGLREVIRKDYWIYVKDSLPYKNYRSLDHGLMVEVLVNGQFAYYGTDNLTLSGIKYAAEKAVEIARVGSKYQVYNFSRDVRKAHTGTYKSKNLSSLDSLSIESVNDSLMIMSDGMKSSDLIISRICGANIAESSTYFVSSNGSNIFQESSSASYNMSATSEKNGEIQTRSYGKNGQFTHELFTTDDLLSEATRVGQESVELLDAENCPTGKFDSIITPDQLYLQLHESIGHPLELDRILGDERNYAGWSFVKPDDFGSLKYGSEILNVTFDPSVETEIASYAFDDVGMKASKEYLIKDGLLLRGIGGIESQTRSNILGTSSSRSTSWNRAPIDRMGNINIEAGDSSIKDMISSTEKGLLIMTNKSWSIDDYRNKFQFGCEYAKLIEDGRITKTLKNPNYKGVTTPFWNNLKMVGDESTYEITGSDNCGKGEPNQAVTVGHALPTCLFKDIEVFGGA